MISIQDVQKICSEYGIGDYCSIEKVLEGVLNDNYILVTSKGKYFIKSVREKIRDRLDVIYDIESLMKSGGIPAITMLTTKDGRRFILSDKYVYTLYPFIENKLNHVFSKEDYFLLGEMLGKIHIIGATDIINFPGLKLFTRESEEAILEKLTNYLNEINNKKTKDDTDELFLKYINFKLNNISKIKKVSLPNDTIIHGDYHCGNILTDDNGKIIGICDWEKTEYAPKSYELARSLFYICYFDGYDPETVLLNTQYFLKGYLSVIPTSIDDIIDGIFMRIYKTCLSSWIEEKYYKEGDSRGNKFIRHEMDMIDLVVNKDLLQNIKKLSFN